MPLDLVFVFSNTSVMPFRKISLFAACVLIVGGGLVGFLWIQLGEEPGSVSAVASSDVRFNRDIRPIFSETCFNCHGPDEHSRESALDLSESSCVLREVRSFS